MRHLDLFSGIGGFSLAASWVWGPNHKIVSFCEIDPFCRKILKRHWPEVPCHDDIKTLKGDSFGTIDLISGGFPCQPYSCAGKRLGKEDDRALWPEMLRVIKEARPSWVIGENVAGIESLFQYDSFSLMEGKKFNSKEAAETCFEGITKREGRAVLDMVVGELEEIGYEVQSFIIPACAVNAPHRRYRVWIIAYRRCELYDASDTSRQGLQRPIRTGTPSGPIAGQTGSWAEPWPEVATRLCGVDARVPNRVDRLKSLGNAIVPQVVVPIMQAIKDIEGGLK